MIRVIFKPLLFLLRTVLRGSPARAAVASFLTLILLGAFLLSLPVSSAEGKWTHPVDALFTSTSSVCVTGLIVKDTARYWSTFGQLVILGMIQAGGLGIMTVYAFLAVALRQRVSMRFEAMMKDLVEGEREEDIWTLVKFICLFTLIAETVGAVSLYVSWAGNFPSVGKAIYFSVFHAISAFCNAGFSVYSDSLARYRGSAPVNAIMALLIVVGGLGFIVVRELLSYFRWRLLVRKGKRPRLSPHTCLVLTVTGVLLLGGFFVIFFTASGTDMQAATMKERLLMSAFQSVTARTAGFNTMKLSPETVLSSTAFLLLALMFIGGSPGSTAGGIKTTTVGVMIASIAATLKGRSRAELFHHSVPSETVHRVASIILLSLSALALGVFCLLITEAGRGFLEILFEATSAFGTVGLTMGLTPRLSTWGRLIIPALMFVGRLGPVTLVLSVARMEDRARYSYPHANVLVG